MKQPENMFKRRRHTEKAQHESICAISYFQQQVKDLSSAYARALELQKASIGDIIGRTLCDRIVLARGKFGLHRVMICRQVFNSGTSLASEMPSTKSQ